MTENTMADLRREVANRLRDTLHGREIDTIEGQMPELPEMLGVVPIGVRSTVAAEKGTLLDHNHSFYDDYYKSVETKRAAHDEIQTAVQSLKDEGVLNIMEPYGSDAGIFYVEVEDLDDTTGLDTTCAECEERVTAEPDIVRRGKRYELRYHIDCPACDFSRVVENNLIRL